MTTTTNALYAAPSITVAANGAQSLLASGNNITTVMVVGTAPQGPDYPVVVDPGRAVSMFGNPASALTVGYTLPFGMSLINAQRQQTSNGSIQFLVCRVGVVRSTIILKEFTGASMALTLQGIGPYAGSAGNNLSVTVVSTGASNPVSVQSITILNGSTQLQQFTSTTYDLSSPAKIAAAINGANPLTNPGSIIQVTAYAGTATFLPASISAAIWSTNGGTSGSDGKNTLATDASVTTAMNNSLWTHADFEWYGWDAAQVNSGSALSSHLNSAQSTFNEFRTAYVGPAYGTSWTTLTTTYQTFNSQRIVCIGQDGGYGLNPANGTITILDGFYLAAAACGLKAVGPVAETTTGMAIAGFSTISTTNAGALLTPTDLNNLGGLGYLVFEQRQSGALYVRDALTTAPYSINNSINPFSQVNVCVIDDAVSNVLVRAVTAFKGRPSSSLTNQIAQIQNACVTALGSLGSTINGINSVVITVDPNTLIPTVNVSYITRYPYLQIAIVTSYSFL